MSPNLRRGGAGKGPGGGRDAIDTCRRRIAEAEFVGWPALADSWKRTLADMEARKAANKLAP